MAVLHKSQESKASVPDNIPDNIKDLAPDSGKNPLKTPNKLNKLLSQGRWTPEARARQAERIRDQKPWLHSTGPKTEKGKKRVSLNSHKHGGKSHLTLRFSKLLKKQKKFMRAVIRMQQKELKNLAAARRAQFLSGQADESRTL